MQQLVRAIVSCAADSPKISCGRNEARLDVYSNWLTGWQHRSGPGAESGYQRGAFGRRQRVRPLRRPRQTQGHVHLLWAARTIRPLATITVATC